MPASSETLCVRCVGAGEDYQDDEDNYYAQHRPAARHSQHRQAISKTCACELTEQVLASVHNSLETLLTAEDLDLGALEVARQHLAGKDEEHELQVATV